MLKSNAKVTNYKLYNLSEARQAWVLGDIGEIIARRYLNECNVPSIAIATYPSIDLIEDEYHPFNQSTISEVQKDYLKELVKGGKEIRRPDLLGFNRVLYATMVTLVEVKTHVRGRPEGVSTLMKRGELPTNEQLTEEKRLGFRHLLVQVRLMPDWKAEISSIEY